MNEFELIGELVTLYDTVTSHENFDHIVSMQILLGHIRYMEATARQHWDLAWGLGQSHQLARYHQRASAHYYAGAQRSREAYIERVREEV